MKFETPNTDGYINAKGLYKMEMDEKSPHPKLYEGYKKLANFVKDKSSKEINELSDKFKNIPKFNELDDRISKYIAKRYIQNKLFEYGYLIEDMSIDVVTDLVLYDVDQLIKNFGIGSVVNTRSLPEYASRLRKMSIAEFAFVYHISPYELFFDELDKKRQENPKLIEVYLGRDAIYMYKARRSEFIGARKNTNKTVAYLPFSRIMAEKVDRLCRQHQSGGYFYESVLHDPCKKMIEKHREIIKDYLKKDAKIDDILFVDTGFVGSIPRFIIKTLFGKKHDANKHIFMLAGSSSETSLFKGDIVDGINIPYEISVKELINVIEHTVKPVYTYEGKTEELQSGKTLFTTYIDTPEKIFAYDFLRHLIMRYFYYKGITKSKQ